MPPLVLGFTAILCIALGAGAAGALNQWYEADLDAKMRRTAKRPLPAGRMDRQTALHFGVGLAAFSVHPDGPCGQLCWRPALLAVSILFYVLVYTVWLKRRTAQNIVIGGAAGRLSAADRLGRGDRPGRAAADAAVRDHLPVDPAAFLGAVAVRPLGLCRGQACRCCRSSPASKTTRRQILLYSLPMAAAAVAPWALGLTGRDLRRRRRRPQRWCSWSWLRWCSPTAPPSRAGWGPRKRLFAYSILYLFALFAALVVDRWMVA